jgi:hypothetical protein
LKEEFEVDEFVKKKKYVDRSIDGLFLLHFFPLFFVSSLLSFSLREKAFSPSWPQQPPTAWRSRARAPSRSAPRGARELEKSDFLLLLSKRPSPRPSFFCSHDGIISLPLLFSLPTLFLYSKTDTTTTEGESMRCAMQKAKQQ